MNEDEKPNPGYDYITWVVWVFIALMLTLLTLRSCL